MDVRTTRLRLIVQRPEQHQTDAAGQRLLRDAFESIGWVVNSIPNDYGVDFEVEIFDKGLSTGAVFKVQLKSSANTHYSSDGSFVSQSIRAANARYLVHELRVPTVVVHCDVIQKRVFWAMPQLISSLSEHLNTLDDDQSVTLRLPVANELPGTAAAFIETLEKADAAVSARAARRVRPSLVAEFGAADGSDIDGLIRAYQAHCDAIRLTEAHRRAAAGDLDKAFVLVRETLDAPGSAISDKFRAWLIWELAELNRHIDAGDSDRSRIEVTTRVAAALTTLVRHGPKYLRYYSGVFSLAAEVSALAHDAHALMMADRFAGRAVPAVRLSLQQLDRRLDLVLIRATRIINRLLRTPEAWVLPIPLSRLAMSVRIAGLRFEQEESWDAARTLTTYGLDLCKAAGKISELTGDQNALASVASTAALYSTTTSDEAMLLTQHILGVITSSDERAFVEHAVEQQRRFVTGQSVDGKIKTTPRQIVQNVEYGVRLSCADWKQSPGRR